jgi:hypothetical protein
MICTNISNLNILKTIGLDKKESRVEADTFEEIYIKTKEHGDSLYIYNPQNVHFAVLK